MCYNAVGGLRQLWCIMLDSLFSKLQLGKSETDTYLALLESGLTSAGELARRMSVPRSSLYGFLRALQQKGLATVGDKAGVKVWQALSPERLLELVDTQLKNWQSEKENLQGLLETLRERQRTDLLPPRFAYYEGAEGVRSLLREMLLYRDIETFVFWPSKDMLEILGEDYLQNHNIERIHQNISIRAIWPSNRLIDFRKHTYLGSGKVFLREIRVAPKGIDCMMGYWAYQNKVAFISSRFESFGFLVESVELRDMLKTQFELLWSLSKPVVTSEKDAEIFLKKLR